MSRILFLHKFIFTTLYINFLLIIQSINIKPRNSCQAIEFLIEKKFGFSAKKELSEHYLNEALSKVRVIKEKTKINSNKTNIDIAMSLDNGYQYITLVAMTSIMENSNKSKTSITFHLMITKDFSQENINILNSIKKKYSQNADIVYYNMSDIFFNCKFNRHHKTTAFYFRLLISELALDIDKIIYLDGDVLVYKDLSELYKIDFNNNYVLGFWEDNIMSCEEFGFFSDREICSGVMLINTKKIRDEKMSIALYEFATTKNYTKANDQCVINNVLYPQIGGLPFKYGIFCFCNEKDILNYYIPHLHRRINQSELIEAFYEPSIVHYVHCNFGKIWRKNLKINPDLMNYCVNDTCNIERHKKIWYKYASLTLYKNEIIKRYLK